MLTATKICDHIELSYRSYNFSLEHVEDWQQNGYN